jgi:glutamate synthase domain-containing protein 1
MFEEQGLYNPIYEHDSCGVGFVANISGEKKHSIIAEGITILCNLEHRGAVGGDQKSGDGGAGASLVVRAINQGRDAAKAIGQFLEG